MTPIGAGDRNAFRPHAVAAAGVGGCGGVLGQILFIRELLVFFNGNELTAGLAFTAWLVWIALGSGLGGRWADRRGIAAQTLSGLLLLLGLLLPLTLLWIRASRLIWRIPVGELFGPLHILIIAFTAVGPFCFISGLLFSAGWAAYLRSDGAPGRQPAVIYLGEALGSAVGGLAFYFILLPRMPVLHASLTAAALIFAAAFFISLKGPAQASRKVVLICSGIALACISWSLTSASSIEQASRRWQWGPDVVAAEDTPYQNLAVLKQKDLYTLFGNGLWMFSAPDPQHAETAVHLALLQHPAPKDILLLGGGPAGLIPEILKHPGIRRIDCVEPDAGLIRLARRRLPPALTAGLDAPEVRLYHEDPAAFLFRSSGAYDAVLMNMGDPVNAGMNRFYTAEFFTRIQSALKPGGVFSFAVSSSPNIIGTAQTRYLRVVRATLAHVFPNVLVYPGDAARFFAADDQGRLIADPLILTDRMAERNLDLTYVREYFLLDLLSPFQMDYIRTLLAPDPAAPERINRDFSPACYFFNMVLWAEQVQTGFKTALLKLAEVKPRRLWMALAPAMALIIFIPALPRSAPRTATAGAVITAGAALMAEEIVLLLGFQILAGFVYTQIAVIIAFFMSGLALGAGLAAKLAKRRPGNPRSRLIRAQAGVCLQLLCVLGLLLLLHSRMQAWGLFPWLPWIFSAMALSGGLLGGLHFSFAVNALSDGKPASARIGGFLYAADILGAAGGALLTSLILLPFFGLVSAMTTVALMTGAGLAALMLKR